MEKKWRTSSEYENTCTLSIYPAESHKLFNSVFPKNMGWELQMLSWGKAPENSVFLWLPSDSHEPASEFPT